MNEQLQSLSKIFTDKIIRIPDYQRGYAWTTKHIEDFWSDLNLLDDKSNHYAGVITFDDVSDETWKTWQEDEWIIRARGYKPYYLVDGQQRLTTSIILIQCIIESFDHNEMINLTDVLDVRKRFIYDAYDEKISRAYKFGYEHDNPSHEFLKTKIFMQDSDRSLIPETTIYTHNLEIAKKYFLEKLAEMTKTEIEIVYRKLTQNFLYNIYSISSEIDIHVSFETMNNRGKPLSHLELLKNRLIYLSNNLKEADHEKIRLRATINSAWGSIYHYLGKNINNPLDDDVFLRSHFIIHFGLETDDTELSIVEPGIAFISNSKNYRTELLDKIFTIKNLSEEGSLDITYIYEYVKSLKTSIEVWYKISNPQDSGYSKEEIAYLTKISMIVGSSSNLTIMAVFLKQTNKRERLKFLEALERCAFIMSLGIRYKGRSYVDNMFYREASDYYNSKLTFEKLVQHINKFVDNLSSDKLLETMVSRIPSYGDGFYGWGTLKYFLYEYEQSLKSEMRNTDDKISSNWCFSSDMDDSIEHVYPQTASADCWKTAFKSIAPTEKSALKNSLGNLVPITKKKNSSLRNSCFETKKGSSNKRVGYRYGTYSEIEISESDQWGPREIINRGVKLLKFMEKRWQVKLGTEEDKIRILGLQKIDLKLKTLETRRA